jgi:hypothetical protein
MHVTSEKKLLLSWPANGVGFGQRCEAHLVFV